MPSPCSPHREPAQHDAAIVDPEQSLRGGDRFQNVLLTRPAIGVVGAAEDVELDIRFRIGFASGTYFLGWFLVSGLSRRLVRMEKAQLVQRVTATVEFHMQRPAFRIFGVVALGNTHRERLH